MVRNYRRTNHRWKNLSGAAASSPGRRFRLTRDPQARHRVDDSGELSSAAGHLHRAIANASSRRLCRWWRGGQRERAPLGVPAYRPAIARMDDRAAKLANASERCGQVSDSEVRQGSGVAGTGSARVDSEAQAARLGFPSRSGRRGPWCELDPEDAVPEPARAVGIVGGEFDQRRGHGREYGRRSRSCEERLEALVDPLAADKHGSPIRSRPRSQDRGTRGCTPRPTPSGVASRCSLCVPDSAYRGRDNSIQPDPRPALQSQKPSKYGTRNPPDLTWRLLGHDRVNGRVWETVSGDARPDASPSQTKGPSLRAFPEAAEGTRTLDLLHGKQTL